MLTMKMYLPLIASLAAAVCHAQTSPSGHPTSGVRQVSVQQQPAPAPAVTSRQLSVQERAELRRQLSDFSRRAGKGS
jgi:hypothetical protein